MSNADIAAQGPGAAAVHCDRCQVCLWAGHHVPDVDDFTGQVFTAAGCRTDPPTCPGSADTVPAVSPPGGQRIGLLGRPNAGSPAEVAAALAPVDPTRATALRSLSDTPTEFASPAAPDGPDLAARSLPTRMSALRARVTPTVLATAHAVGQATTTTPRGRAGP